MNKKELTTVAVLILMIPAWLWIDRTFVKPLFPEPPPRPTPTATVSPVASDEPADARTPVAEKKEVDAAAGGGSEPALGVPETNTQAVEAQRWPLVMRSEDGDPIVTASFSNLDASVHDVTLHQYPVDLASKDDPAQNPIVLDFAKQPALELKGESFASGPGFQVAQEDGGRRLTFTRVLENGLRFHRRVEVQDAYVLKVEDTWENPQASALQVPEVTLFLGPMFPIEGISQKFGPYIGIDAQHGNGVGVKRYWKDMRKGLKSNDTFEQTIGAGVDWFSVKNKFFAQVLTLEPGDAPGAESLSLQASRGEGEALITAARPSVDFDNLQLPAGGRVSRQYVYYVGPVSMDRLTDLGGGQEKVIDFRLLRFFVPIATLMMKGLNGLYGITGNWGVAIILLTFVVRMLFWPLTQKGAENMKKMSELSPQMKELREKHKNNPQKLNQEMAAFYKKHQVNPMAGCLPMLVQIPVFISLYGVLRVAVQLRFADFLWIRDLSEQEALFMIGDFAVNILPLTMGATMVLQQRLTPSNMDPQQQKIMTMMPIVFLFITYTMPSGLLLYWTTSNLVSIYQTTHTRRRDARKERKKSSAAPGKVDGKASKVKK